MNDSIDTHTHVPKALSTGKERAQIRRLPAPVRARLVDRLGWREHAQLALTVMREGGPDLSEEQRLAAAECSALEHCLEARLMIALDAARRHWREELERAHDASCSVGDQPSSPM